MPRVSSCETHLTRHPASAAVGKELPSCQISGRPRPKNIDAATQLLNRHRLALEPQMATAS